MLTKSNFFLSNDFNLNHDQKNELIQNYENIALTNLHDRAKINNFLKNYNNYTSEEFKTQSLKTIANNYNFFSNLDFFKRYDFDLNYNEKKDLIEKQIFKLDNLFDQNNYILINNFEKNYTEFLSPDKKKYFHKLYKNNYISLNAPHLSNIGEYGYKFNISDFNDLANLKVNKFGIKSNFKDKINNFFEVIQINNKINTDYSINYIKSDKFLHRTDNSNINNIISKSKKDYLLLYGTSKAEAIRSVSTKNSHLSTYLAGTQTIENPAYAKLLIELQITQNQMLIAQQNLATARIQQSQYESNVAGQPCGTTIFEAFACGMLQGSISQSYVSGPKKEVNRLRSSFNSQQSKLNNTPMTIQKNIFEKYKYNTSKIQATKNTNVNFYLIDKKNNNIFSNSINDSEKKYFTLIYNLKYEDRDYNSLKNKYEDENIISNWEKRSKEIKIEKMINNLSTSNLVASKFNDYSDVENIILMSFDSASNDIDFSNLNNTELYDKRFQSVVVVNNPNGGMGTGFFVTSNVILTNYHVVEGSNNVGIELFNQNNEIQGRVIASDVRLDLALVKVSRKGIPAKLATGQTPKIGSEVEAIGHPFGQNFTLTKGIISAIRQTESTYNVGGKLVKYIQTDAAVNSGNSGGPLFYKEAVVGVNTQVIRKDMAEGLNFAVHFTEFNKFLKNNL